MWVLQNFEAAGLDTGAHVSVCCRAQGAVASLTCPCAQAASAAGTLCRYFRVTAKTLNNGVLDGGAPDNDLLSP